MFSPAFGSHSMHTRPFSSRQFSRITTASTPAGTIPPVRILKAEFDGKISEHSSPAQISAITGSVIGTALLAPLTSARLTPYPSTDELSKRGTS
jgi:hypothetical protein